MGTIHQARETHGVLAVPEAVDRDKEEGQLEEQLASHDGPEPLGRASHEEVPKLLGVPGEQVLAGLGVEGGGDSLGIYQKGDGYVRGKVQEENPPQQGRHAAGDCGAAAAGVTRGGHAPVVRTGGA